MNSSSEERPFSKPVINRGRVAFTLVELAIVIAVIAIIGAVLLPAMMRHPKRARNRCISNLMQIGLAFRIWEGDNGDHYPMTVLTNNAGWRLYTNSTDVFRYFQVMSNELANPDILHCEEDTKRRKATNFTTDFDGSHISYFIGMIADETIPQLFLAGDSHLTNGQPLKNGNMTLQAGQPAGWTKERHGGLGNIALADGSVQQFTSAGLQTFLQKSGLTNHLLFPP